MTVILPDATLSALHTATRVVVLTGAGMSAESGVATFRDPQDGLWSKYRPEDLATPEAFDAEPGRVWDWYQWRREKIGAVRPHAGYRALVELEQRLPSLWIITQNVDGLHRAAGSSQVIELHGNIRGSICSRTRRAIDSSWLAAHPGSPPPSPHAANGLARPDVVWFGEALPEESLAQAWSISERAEFFFSVGTSARVHPAATLPLLALRSGATFVEINPEPTPLSHAAHHCIRQPAGQALPGLLKLCRDSEQAV